MPVILKSLRMAMLTSRKFDLSIKLTQISQKIMDLQTYASNIADGSISQAEMAGAPSSMFGNQMQYMTQSSQIAYQSAQVKTNAYLQQNGMIAQGTGGQYQLAADGQAQQMQPYLIFNEVYKQELKEYSNQLAQKANVEEKQLTAEQKRLETQLKMVEAEYQNIEKTLDDDIKNSAIKLA